MKTHAVIPLAVLEAVRSADVVSVVPGFDNGDDVPSVRLGGTPTIIAQIERYQILARRGSRVPPDDVGGILKLIGRRRDADLVMAEAGRRVGELVANAHTGRTMRTLYRMAPRMLRNRIGAALVRRTARAIFDVDISVDHVARWTDPGGLTGSSGGVRVCEVFRAATAELLRRFTSFEGALFHQSCRDKGDDVCVWSAQPTNERVEHAE